jgi:hypothetical protein
MSQLVFHVCCAALALVASTAFAQPVSGPQRTLSPTVPKTVVQERQVPGQVQGKEKGAAPDVLNLTQPQTAKRDPLDIFSGGPAGYLLSQYLKTAVDFTPEAARRQRMALNALKQAPPNVRQQMVSELVAAYQRMPEGEYDRRWLLVDTLSQLDDQQSTEHLGMIALTALPPERVNRKNADWSSRDEEISIRLAAVRGLTKLSAKQVSAAEGKLILIAARSNITAVRKQAILGYVDAPARSAKIGTLEGFRKTPVFTQRLTNIKRQIPPDAQKMADEVTMIKPDISIPVEVIQAVQNRKMRIEPQQNDPAPAARKGGLR